MLNVVMLSAVAHTRLFEGRTKVQKSFFNPEIYWIIFDARLLLWCPAASTVVEQLPHHPKVKGLSPAIAAGTGRETMTKRYVFMF